MKKVTGWGFSGQWPRSQGLWIQETEHCNRLVTQYTPAGLEMSLCCAEGGVTVGDELLWTRDNRYTASRCYMG